MHIQVIFSTASVAQPPTSTPLFKSRASTFAQIGGPAALAVTDGPRASPSKWAKARRSFVGAAAKAARASAFCADPSEATPHSSSEESAQFLRFGAKLRELTGRSARLMADPLLADAAPAPPPPDGAVSSDRHDDDGSAIARRSRLHAAAGTCHPRRIEETEIDLSNSG